MYKHNAQRVIAHAADPALQYSTLECMDVVPGSNVNTLREIKQQSDVSRRVGLKTKAFGDS